MESKIVVSCFYTVSPKPGRSHNLYKEWFQNFLKTLNCEIIVFTDEGSKKFLNISEKKIKYQIVPFDKLFYFKNYGLEFWGNQQIKDPNQNRTWKLSVLYNEKSKFIERAIELYPNIEWFIWADIGCFRQKIDISFPVISHLKQDKITLLQIKKFKKKELQKDYFLHPEKQVRLGGGVQVASKNIWIKYIKLYQQIFEKYVKYSSVNCDQGLIGTLAIENKHLVDLIPSKKTRITKSRWFYLLEYCSDNYKTKNSFFGKFWQNLKI